MQQAAATIAECRKTNIFWSEYVQSKNATVSFAAADEVRDQYATIKLEMEMHDGTTVLTWMDPADETNIDEAVLHQNAQSDDSFEIHTLDASADAADEDSVVQPVAKPRPPLPDRMCFKCGSLCKNLELHLANNHSELECDMCGRTFIGKALMRGHFRNDHRPPRSVEQCQVCQKSFRMKSHLNNHMRRHVLDVVTCAECGKVYDNTDKLKYHMIRHGPKTLSCSVEGCPIRFWFSKDLLTHRRNVHEKIRRFACDCGKRFFTKIQLNTHTRNQRCESLSGCRPTNNGSVTRGPGTFQPNAEYKCETCGKVFVVKAYLTKHHKFKWCPGPNAAPNVKARLPMDRSKQYACEVCGKRYLVQAFLQKHHSQGKCRGRPGARSTTASRSLGGLGASERKSIETVVGLSITSI